MEEFVRVCAFSDCAVRSREVFAVVDEETRAGYHGGWMMEGMGSDCDMIKE